MGPWDRVGGNGAYVDLDGNGHTNDAYVCEILPGKSLNPERHMFEKLIYVLSGRGATSITQGGRDQTFEWGPGAIFSIPVNAKHQHHNGSGTEAVRFAAVTSAPMVMSIFNSVRFVFENEFEFDDRATTDKQNTGDGTLWQSTTGRHVWETNFVPDVVNFKLFSLPRRGAGGSNITFELGYNSLAAHISEFPVGTYKKAHWHGPGAHVFVLSGQGYSLLWPKDGKREDRIRVDWKPGSLVVPPNEWFHQHFNRWCDAGSVPGAALGQSPFRKDRRHHAEHRGRGQESRRRREPDRVRHRGSHGAGRVRGRGHQEQRITADAAVFP